MGAAPLITSGVMAGTGAPATAAPEAEQPVRFDFGPGAVAEGYQQVTAGSVYDADRGYGFAEGSTVTETDRTGDALKGDFVTPTSGSFVVDLPNVDYTISLVAGDSGGTTEIAIAAESIQKVLTTSKAPGQYLEMNFDLALVDGQLTLEFSGATPNINALVITPQPARSAATAPTAYLASDSTVQTYDPYWVPQVGWARSRLVGAGSLAVGVRTRPGAGSTVTR